MRQAGCVAERELVDLLIEGLRSRGVLTLPLDIVQMGKQLLAYLFPMAGLPVFRLQNVGDVFELAQMLSFLEDL
jgi:hypothetical protein